jgi:4-hydroxybenzoate polyprenyltransferase
MKEIISLSRWREHIPFTIPLTILGAIVAASNGAALDSRLIFVVLANIATVSYAFMINDIEDAEDDSRDKAKAKRNPISAGRLSEEDAYTVVRVLAVVALVLYGLTNVLTFGIGITTLLLSHLYSWRKVRLKAYPVTDIVSHSLMLSGLLLLSGFSAFSSEFRHIWILTATATMFSVYGQLYNQVRDYDVDEKAGLKNTTILVGKRKAQFLMNASIVLSVVSLLTAIYFKTFPIWLLAPVFISSPIVFSFKAKKDSSGTAAINMSGKLQLQLLLVFNIVVLFWLAQVFMTTIL